MAEKNNFKQEIGKEGENIAANHLESRGYTILDRNFRAGRGEIDIIAKQGSVLAFVEVKTKKHGDFGDPVYWVTKNKQRQIGRIAKAYLQQRAIEDMDIRFDVITLDWKEGAYQLDHIENAFWL